MIARLDSYPVDYSARIVIMKSKDGRYEICESHSSDHFMLKDWYWSVVEVKTGRVVASFSGEFDGTDLSGTQDVSFTDDGRHLKIKDHGKRERVIPIESPDHPAP